MRRHGAHRFFASASITRFILSISDGVAKLRITMTSSWPMFHRTDPLAAKPPALNAKACGPWGAVSVRRSTRQMRGRSFGQRHALEDCVKAPWKLAVDSKSRLYVANAPL